MLSISENKGFQLTFSNGWTVSVQFGPYNYCANRDAHFMSAFERNMNGPVSCENAEIAAWDRDGKWHHFETDDVKGWCNADEVADFIAKVKSF